MMMQDTYENDAPNEAVPPLEPADPLALTQDEYADILREIEEQPYWRSTADKEMDYADGNQLDSDLLRKQKENGVPPAVEDLIGPALLSIQGYETVTRTDWRVTPNGDVGGQEVADAINYKLNQAERQSKADAACSDAFRPQIACGMGVVEVARQSDPFKFPYRCLAIHRNECHWDMKHTEPDGSDMRWFRRMRWMEAGRIADAFPEHAELIKLCGKNGGQWWQVDETLLDGGTSTGLQNVWDAGRAWTVQEDRWYNPTNKELALAEMWYRRWVRIPVLKTPDGRVVEFDENNLAHNVAVASGRVKIIQATVARVRRSYWLGPHCLHDGPTPYTHTSFPYVLFRGFAEDGTKVPYGYVRSMKYAQDSLNSSISKMRWGMSVARVERTKGAVAMTDAQLRRQLGRADADIVLDAEHMRQQGARFEVKRDFDLTDQQHQMMNDNRASIQRTSAVTAGFMGKEGTARSGLQEQTQVEQSNQSLARMMDNFRTARSQVGELLMAMIIEDMGSEPQTIIIEGDAVTADRSVHINSPEKDPFTGQTYLSNDLQRTRLKVALEDVPSTQSYRGQQLNAMSEAVKSLPPQYQAAAMPFLASLMDVPFKRELVEALRAAGQAEDPAAVEQRVRADIANELKARELDLKEAKNQADIQLIVAQAVQTGVQAAFSAMQGGAQIAQMPMIAPIADKIMQGAGYKPAPGGVDPNFPVAAQTAAMNIKSPYIQGEPNGGVATPEGEADAAAGDMRSNTSPTFPAPPVSSDSGMDGIETARTSDNLPAGVEQ